MSVTAVGRRPRREVQLEAAEVRTDHAIQMLNSDLGDQVDVNENHGLCKGHF